MNIFGLMFQSLFSWKSPSDNILMPGIIKHGRVSILVFVEVALGLSLSIRAGQRGRVSILVFVEVALGPSEIEGA